MPVMRKLRMSIQKALISAVLVASLATSIPDALASDYRCIVERVETPKSSDSPFHQLYVGREFTVDRISGVMAGALKNNYVTSPEVIDRGSSDNAFKVLGSLRLDQGAGAGSNVYLLTINEYDSSPRKPFLFAQNDVAYFGYCTHF